METTKCPECGRDILRGSDVCPGCGFPLKNTPDHYTVNADETAAVDKAAKKPTKKRTLSGIILAVIILLSVIPLSVGLLRRSRPKEGVEVIPAYSYTQRTTNYEYAPWVLRISNVRVQTRYSFTTVDGRLTNNGSRTYSFVKVRGAFKNYSGTVVDTDWTYAVGSEGLAPGESTTFHMSVSANSSIRNCDVTVFEYR